MVSSLESLSPSGHPHFIKLINLTILNIGLLSELVRHLAHLLPIPYRLFKIFLPFFNTISGSFSLQTSKNSLVFNRNFDQLLSSYVPIHGWLYHHFWVVKRRFWLLHNVRHLLQKDSVFPFDLSKTVLLHHFSFASFLLHLLWTIGENLELLDVRFSLTDFPSVEGVFSLFPFAVQYS